MHGRVHIVMNAGRNTRGDINVRKRSAGFGRSLLDCGHGRGQPTLGTEVQHDPIGQLAAESGGTQGQSRDVDGNVVCCRARLHGHAGQLLARGHIADRANILAHKGPRFVHFFLVESLNNGPVAHPESQNQPTV